MQFITLTRGLFTVVDDADFGLLQEHLWNAHACKGRFYAAALMDGKQIYLHRFLMGFPKCGVDHKNRFTLDNRRDNLRLATQAQNLANMLPSRVSESGFIGVRKRVLANRAVQWAAYMSIENKQKHFGAFSTPVEAAKARDAAALKFRGEFAVLNFQNRNRRSSS